MSAPPPPSDAISEALLAEIASRGGVRHYPANAVLINEGDSGDSLYFILSGLVEVFTSSPDGRERVHAEHGPGEYFGELSLDGQPRSASVRAIEPCSCRVVRGADMRQFLAEHPDFAMHLALKLIRMVRRLTDQAHSLATHDVYGRLARLLMESSDENGDGERVTRHKLTQQDIAFRIGASREMVNRLLKDLVAGGFVALLPGGRYAIRRKLPAAW